MNESELIIYLLTRKRGEETIGATQKELLEALSLTDRNSKSKLFNLLEEINSNMAFLGIRIKLNPANNHWFIEFKDSISSVVSEQFKSNLPSRLAATLFSVLLLIISNGGPISPSDITEIRNKKKIGTDLTELEEYGFIRYEGNSVYLTPKVFYHIDIDQIGEEINKFNSDKK